jgi:hypothetical protein
MRYRSLRNTSLTSAIYIPLRRALTGREIAEGLGLVALAFFATTIIVGFLPISASSSPMENSLSSLVEYMHGLFLNNIAGPVFTVLIVFGVISAVVSLKKD